MNDVVLALCAGAMRKLLSEQDALPFEPMTAMIPVNIRPKDDPGGGNAVGAVLASLATDLDDPLQRFRAIVASTRAAKEQLTGLSQNAIMQYSAASRSPFLPLLAHSPRRMLHQRLEVVLLSRPRTSCVVGGSRRASASWSPISPTSPRARSSRTTPRRSSRTGPTPSTT